ncbi:MAG: diphthine synthase [Nanoarchaeota archaeon]|nr:diphthine synthase [Nanoarchaeota archaeon]
MLYLIGLGLGSEKSLTIEGLEAAKKCECCFESYTSKYESLGELENLVGKKIKILKRGDVEEGSQKILDSAKKKDVAVLVTGDPLAATTHIYLAAEAKKQKIPIKIIHNASIFSAIAETGLQLYKFGRTATIPYTRQAESVKDALEGNRKLGLHTLLLLDLDAPNRRYMSVKEALEILLEKKIISGKEKLIAAHISGSSQIFYGIPEELAKKKIDAPSVLIVPGKLHFMEKDFLEMLG